MYQATVVKLVATKKKFVAKQSTAIFEHKEAHSTNSVTRLKPAQTLSPKQLHKRFLLICVMCNKTTFNRDH